MPAEADGVSTAEYGLLDCRIISYKLSDATDALSGCGNEMSACQDGVSGTADTLPRGRNKVSASADEVSAMEYALHD